MAPPLPRDSDSDTQSMDRQSLDEQSKVSEALDMEFENLDREEDEKVYIYVKV